eukprot:1158835-Pelagomonas_calceolata.AAC.22
MRVATHREKNFIGAACSDDGWQGPFWCQPVPPLLVALHCVPAPLPGQERGRAAAQRQPACMSTCEFVRGMPSSLIMDTPKATNRSIR